MKVGTATASCGTLYNNCYLIYYKISLSLTISVKFRTLFNDRHVREKINDLPIVIHLRDSSEV